MLASRLYYDSSFHCEAVKILPGEYYVTNKAMLIGTVLGSCVSACIRDRVSGIGGMNHFMLPDAGSDQNNPISASARYGAYAMELLVNQLMKMGAVRKNLEAKVFGGGNVLSNLSVMNIGDRNANFVRKYLNNEDIRIVGEDLHDCHARKVYYFPSTGRVMVKKIEIVASSIINMEKDYYESIKTKKPAVSDIDLF
ncbi:MAG: chemoreceptor glutamine deamidase CheD [Candidatus Methylumidiphilus sp.]